MNAPSPETTWFPTLARQMTASLSWRDPSLLFQTGPRKGLNRTDLVLDERPSTPSSPDVRLLAR